MAEMMQENLTAARAKEFRDNFKLAEMDDETLITFAKLAEGADRYQDMRLIMEERSKRKAPLEASDRNLLSVAYKHVLGHLRNAWRVMNEAEGLAAIQDVPNMERFKKSLEQGVADVSKEITTRLKDMIDQIKPDDDAPVDDEKWIAKVFYLKMVGDYNRYLAEVSANKVDGKETETMKEAKKACGAAYEAAKVMAEKHLAVVNGTRLGLSLNYSVCLYEIINNKKMAKEVAKKAFDNAVNKLDSLKEQEYKDATIILQLLRDNLTIWGGDDNDEEGGDDAQPEN